MKIFNSLQSKISLLLLSFVTACIMTSIVMIAHLSQQATRKYGDLDAQYDIALATEIISKNMQVAHSQMYHAYFILKTTKLDKFIEYNKIFCGAVNNYYLFMNALIHGSNTAAFQKSDGGINYTEWVNRNLQAQYKITSVPNTLREHAEISLEHFSKFEQSALKAMSLIRYAIHSNAINDALIVDDKAQKAIEKNIVAAEREYQTSLRATITLVQAANANVSNYSRETIVTSYHTMIIQIILLMIIALFFILTTWVWIKRSIVKPLKHLLNNTNLIKQGSFTLTPAHYKNTDEIGMLTNSFQEMAENLQQVTISRNYFDNILQSIGDMLFITNTKGEMRELNHSLLSTLGYSKDELLDQHFNKIVCNTLNEKTINEQLQSFSENNAKHILSFEWQLTHKNKATIPINLTISYLVDNVNQQKLIIWAAANLTDLQGLKKQVDEKQLQLIHASRLISLGEMATGIAHEINQPLSIIKISMQSLLHPLQQNKTLDLSALDIIERATKQVERCSKIIENMRKFASKRNTFLEAVNLTTAVQSSLFLFNEQFRLRQIKLSANTQDNLPLIQANQQQLEQIIVNLLSNAQHAVEEMHAQENNLVMEVTIDTYYDSENQSVVLAISDNGIGMDRNQQAKCLEPFYTTKTADMGTGLGLSIVYTLIRGFNASLQIVSAPFKGSTFKVTFKIVE